jgi:hypothetical protein
VDGIVWCNQCTWERVNVEVFDGTRIIKNAIPSPNPFTIQMSDAVCSFGVECSAPARACGQIAKQPVQPHAAIKAGA